MNYRVIVKNKSSTQKYFKMPDTDKEEVQLQVDRYTYKLEPIDPKHPTGYVYLETDENLQMGDIVRIGD